MSTIKEGDTVPSGEFAYIAVKEDDPLDQCQRPGKLSTDEWKGKKIVLVGVPGAFTPGCQERHVPPFIQEVKKGSLKVPVYVVANNDMFVMSAWGKVLKGGDIKFIADCSSTWLKEAGLTQDLTALGLGVRAKRFALIIDDMKVTYAGIESGRDIEASSLNAVLAKL